MDSVWDEEIKRTSAVASVSVAGARAPNAGLAVSLTGLFELFPKLFNLPMSPPGVVGVGISALGVPGVPGISSEPKPGRDCCRARVAK